MCDISNPCCPIVYLIRPDGSGFRRIASKPGWCLGSPKWSPDGKRVVFYELPTEDTWGARRPNSSRRCRTFSVDVASGERIVHSSGPGLKLFPHFLNGTDVAYHRKGGASEGLAYTTGIDALKRATRLIMRQLIYRLSVYRNGADAIS